MRLRAGRYDHIVDAEVGSIDELKLEPKTSNALKVAGIDTVANLRLQSDEALLAIPGIKPAHLEAIRAALHAASD